MGGINLNKYLTDIPEYTTGRLRYNPVNMLKTVLFGFMTSGYCSLRELEDNCKVNIRFMYLMDHQTPSYRTFGYFINEVLQDKVENIFNDINQAIFNEEHVDLQHIYIDGSKFEANANKYTWVWKKATEKFRYKLYKKITVEIEEINKEIAWSEVQISTNSEYVPDYLNEIIDQLMLLWDLDISTFVYGSGKRKSKEQRHYEHLTGFCQKLQEYIEKIDELVDEGVNKYIVEKEYAEFISLLKMYVNSKEPETEEIHLIYTNGESILLDKNKDIITIANNSFNAKYLSDITFSSNDFALNALLSLLPKKINVHLITKKDEFIDTLCLIFEEKVYMCTDCNICRTYKIINSAK